MPWPPSWRPDRAAARRTCGARSAGGDGVAVQRPPRAAGASATLEVPLAAPVALHGRHDVGLGGPDPGEPLDRAEDNICQGPLIGDLDEREDVGLAPTRVGLFDRLQRPKGRNDLLVLPGLDRHKNIRRDPPGSPFSSASHASGTSADALTTGWSLGRRRRWHGHATCGRSARPGFGCCAPCFPGTRLPVGTLATRCLNEGACQADVDRDATPSYGPALARG
jgi:hypothetical protein